MKKEFIRFISALLWVVLLTQGLSLTSNYYYRYIGQQAYTDLQEYEPIDPNLRFTGVLYQYTPPKPKEKEAYLLEYKNNFAKLKSQNQDTIGWINLPGSQINFPVIQSYDNDYYLRRGFDKAYNIMGSIFADYKNDSDFTDQNTVLYGHHMYNESGMFSDLEKLRNQDYFDQHRFITIKLETKLLIYEIFSVYPVDAAYDYRTPNYGSNFGNFVTTAYNNSVVSTYVVPTQEDRILTLSTCNYDVKDGRLAVHAVLKEVVDYSKL